MKYACVLQCVSWFLSVIDGIWHMLCFKHKFNLLTTLKCLSNGWGTDYIEVKHDFLNEIYSSNQVKV